MRRPKRYVAAVDGDLETSRRFFTKDGAFRWAWALHAETGEAYVVARVHRDGVFEILAAMPKVLTTNGTRRAYAEVLKGGRRHA